MYRNPIILTNDSLFEGVYAASGCYTTINYDIKQAPEIGQEYYCIQLDFKHNADHNSNKQRIHI